MSNLPEPVHDCKGKLMNSQELKPEDLYQHCDPEEFSFETTEELEELSTPVGQPRAAEALRFGMGVKGNGFNIFALGPPGSGKHSLLNRLIGRRAQAESKPPDISYVNNFDEPQKPSLLQPPAGRGVELRNDMEGLLEEVRSALKAALESEEFQTRRQSLEEEFKEKQEKQLEELKSRAEERKAELEDLLKMAELQVNHQVVLRPTLPRLIHNVRMASEGPLVVPCAEPFFRGDELQRLASELRNTILLVH
jgi:hypothetical protein